MQNCIIKIKSRGDKQKKGRKEKKEEGHLTQRYHPRDFRLEIEKVQRTVSEVLRSKRTLNYLVCPLHVVSYE